MPMSLARRAWCRSYQAVMRAALPLLPYREPELLDGAGALPAAFAALGVRRVLVVTGPRVAKTAFAAELLAALEAAGMSCTVFSAVRANPTTDTVEEALALYRAQGCEALVGLGGGSPLDCAKAVAARVARPGRSLAQMEGLLKVGRPVPPLAAVPTTAGSGSEATLAAVVTDAATRHKYAINDFALIPRFAVLDARATLTLPASVTAQTGMDALTHAVEAYVGKSTTAQTRAAAEKAVRLIVANLARAVADGGDLEARHALLHASYQAGIAFTRSYVGYVHGLAHAVGGAYDVAHGLANAVLLPRVLRAYGASAQPALARLARVAGLAGEKRGGAGDAAAAEAFISWVEKFNAGHNIPAVLDCIQPSDIPALAAHADRECNPLYPVPRLMDKGELAEVLAGTCPGAAGA